MKSFRDPVTDVLRSYGYADSNGDDLAREEPDEFNLEPGKWQLVGDEWQPYEDKNAAILAQIASIEQITGVPRVVREMMLTYAEDLAQRTAEQMTAEGQPTTPEELLSQNVAYVKTKEVDEQIRALRSQLV